MLKSIKLILLTIILMISTILIPGKAYAAVIATSDIILTCDKQQVNVGDILTVSLKSQSEVNIFGIQFQMKYDPTLIRLQSNGMQPQGKYTSFGGVTEDTGKGILIYPLINNTTDTSITKEIAKVNFIALKKGTSEINLSSIKAVDNKSNIVSSNNSFQLPIVIVETSVSGGTGGTGGSTTVGTSTETIIPVVTKIDSNLNVVATLDASKIDTSKVNVISLNEPKLESKVQVQIPASAIGTGTGRFEINTKAVSLSIPTSIIDSSLLSSGGTLRVSQNVMATADANALLMNISTGAKTNGKVFTFSMAVYDSNNNLVSNIHNFANGKSVAVTINLNNDDIKGMDTSKISAFYFDLTSKKWVDIGGSFDLVKMTYTFNTTHFTDFTIMQKVETNVQRLSGASRIETSIAIAKEQYTATKPDAVVLATANGFADALVGSGLAYKYNSPLLLVNKTVSDSKKVLDYIMTSLGKNKNIYILGGTAAVSNEISDYLTVQGYKIIRLGGVDRYETNQKIVDYLNISKGTNMIIATGNNFADTLSISSIADIKGLPVLLNDKDNLSTSVSGYITKLQPTTIYVIGGTGVISTNVENQIKKLNGNIQIVRLGGKDRYETSMMIVDYFNLPSTTITVATGKDFPDALSGSVLAARKNSAVLLVDNKVVSKQKALLVKQKITKVIVFGGEGVISNDIATSLIE